MTSISSGSGPVTGPHGEPTGTSTSATATDRPVESAPLAGRDGAGDAAALARTEAARTEAPGSGMTEGPRLELQQWASRLSDLNRDLEALPAGSAEANAKLAEIRQHLTRLAALQSRVEEGLRSGPAALAQDYLLLLSSSRSALAFLNAHRSDPGSEAFAAEATLIGGLQSRRDRSLASLRTLSAERLLPSLSVAADAEPSEQQIGDYRLLLRINGVLGEAELETVRVSRDLTTAYAAHTHPDTVAAGGELPDYLRSSFFRELDPNPPRTGEAPAAHSPDAAFPEGHPMRDLYRTLWEHRHEPFSEADANRLIQQLQSLRGELAEGGRYANFVSGSNRGNLTASLENLERLLRNDPRRVSEDDVLNTERPLRLLGTLEYQAQLQSSAGTSTRGRIGLYWRLYEEYRRLGNGEAARGCLYNIYQASQMNLLPENRTNGLSEADRQAVLVRFLEAYVDTGRLDVNFASMMGSLGREITRLWGHGTEESRFTALSLWTRYNGLHRRIDAEYSDGAMNFLLLEPPHRLLGTTAEGLPALLQDMENRARASEDPNAGAARLIAVAQAYASGGDMDTCTAILRGVEGSIAAHPANEGNPFASRTLILGAFSSAGMSHLLGDYIDGWIASDRAALREARPRDRAHLLSETLQDWASLMSGLSEIGRPEMASRVFAALDAEMAPLTPESRARVYREILPHMHGAQREEILNRVRDLIGSDAERSEPLSVDARVQLNAILGEFSTDPFEIQGAFTALTSIVRHERPSPEMRVEIHRYRLALRNHIHDLVRNHPDITVEGSDIREMWLWADGYGGRDGGSNAIVDELTEARRALLNRLSSAANPGERRRILTLLNDSFREGMRMRLHGNDYGLQAFVDQHLEMIRALRPSERPSVFAESLQFLNQMEVDRMRARGREVTSFRNVYYDTMTAALPSLIADIPAGPERRSAILQFTRALSQAREAEERRLRAAERALVAIRATSAHHWAVEHGFDERFLCRTEAEAVDALRPAVEAMRRMETSLWNQFAEGESIPEARRVYEGFARAMSLTVEGRSGEARAAMTAYYSDPEVQAFLRSDPAGDAHRAEAQAQIQQLLDVSATILNGEAGARFDRTLRIVRGLARIRLHTLRAEGEEFPYDIGTIDRMTMELPRFLATLPPDRMPQTFEAALQLFGAANEGNARLVSEYNGAINRIPVQHVGEDGAGRTGSVWGLIRAMEHIGEPGGAERAFSALQQVVADDTDWDLLSREGRGDLGPALQDFCDIILEEGTNVSPDLRQRVADFRARIPEEEEWGHFLRQTFNWQLAVDIGLMALSGGVGGLARAAVSRIVIGLVERAALRMVSTTAIRMTMMAGRGIAYVGGHVASGVTFNLIHASTSALILNRPMENPFASGLRMSADSMINDPISMMLFSSIPGPSSMVGRFLYRQVATAITFQISQNIRYHAERGARDLLDSDFHRAVERREHMRAMWEATGDRYYLERFETAERSVTEIIGHEPDNSVRGIMLNIGMNIGQAGADHVMGTHHWAGNFGLEEAPRAATERPGAPRSEAERAARREHHVSLADALANARVERLGSGREAAGGPYRGGAEEGPAREAAARRAGEERAFFRELVDLDAYEHYAPESLDAIVDHVARRFDPHGVPPALNEASRRFIRFFLTHVNPEHANRVGPEGLATLIEAAMGPPVIPERPAERTMERPADEASPIDLSGVRRLDLEGGRRILRDPRIDERIRNRESSPETELGLRLMADEVTAEAMAHLDDLLRGADPEALRTPEGRERFLRGYREARAHLDANPDALGGLRPHEALAALMGREGGEDLPTAARRLVAGEIRLRPRSAAEHGLLPPGVHAESPLRRLVAEELTARHQETSLREAARAVEHARREVRELTALLGAREGDTRFAALEAQTRDIRVRLEAAQRRVGEVRERIRELRRAERELSRRGLDPERRRELSAEANRLRRDIARRIEGIRNSEAGVTRFVAAVRALERATPRPATDAPAREDVRVEVSEEGTERRPGTETEASRRGAEEGPEIEIVDEGVRIDLSEADETAPGARAEELPPHLADPAASATGAATRMNTGVMAALGISAFGAVSLAASTVNAQDTASTGGHGLVADSAQFLSSFLHLSPMAMTGTVATVALGFGAVYAIFRRAARARAAERAPAGVRESAAARSRASETARGDAEGGGRERQEGDAHREDSAGTELPARMEQAPDTALAAPEAPRVPAVETSFEGVLQDNAPGAPRRGAIAVREAGADYGTASGATHEGVGYKDSNEDALVHGVDATGARYAVVLDGMGGMGRGDQASRLAGEVIQAEMSAHGDLMRAFGAAHEAVRRRYPGAGACAVAHRVFRGSDGRMRMEIVHVGDSGAAVFGRDGRVIYRTRDQSQVQMLADAGLIEGGELAMRTHPDVNVVLGGLGPSRVQAPVRHEIVLEGGERAVMFSDGLGDNVSTEEIVRRVSESGSAEEAQNGLMGLALQRMGILDALYPQFDALPEGARIPFTAPDGRTLYLARDLPVSQLQGGVVEMMNVYDAAEGGNLIDHFKPDNVAVHVYFHDPAAPAATRADEAAIVTAPPGEDFGAPPPAPRLGEAPADAEVYVPTQVPAEGAPPPVDLAPPPPPRLGLAADAAEARTIDLLNQAQTPELRPPARPGEPFELHFPDLAGLIPVGTERIAGAGAISDPRVAPRHAVVERIGPDALLVQNLGEHQTFVVMPDGSHYPVGQYGFVIRSGQEIVMGGTRVRVTAEGRAPDPDAPGPFGYHPFRGHQSFSPNFANGPQEGFGARIHPESGIVPGVGRSYAVESLAAETPISVRENPADPNSPWRPLAPGERHRLRFEHGVSEEFRNAEGLVSRMTRHGEIVHVRGGEIALEVEAPGAPPIELALGERERFVIGTRPESDVALPPYAEADGRVLLDPYLHIPSSPDPRLRYAPDIPADHAEIYRTPEGEWRIRNLSGAVMEITGRGENHFFLPRGGEVTLSDGQQIVFRGERPYRYRFRVPRSEAPAGPEPALPRAEVGRRTSAWLEAPDAAALNQRLAAEGVPLRVRAQEGPHDAEAAVRALAETPPTLLLRFENGRLTPDSVELLYAFAAMPEPLRAQLRASARAFEGLFTDLTLRENPLALHYLRESANIFHTRVFLEGAPELAQALASLRPENVAEAQAALARLFFWGPGNLGRESNLSLSGISGNDGFYLLNDTSPQEFPDPVERARVQARIEAAREDGRRAQAEAELIRARIQEHFRNVEAPEMPALGEAGLRALVDEMTRNARAPELRPAERPAQAQAESTAEAPVLEARRRGRQVFRELGEVLSAYAVRRSPELTATLQNLRETLRGGDARELAARLERARDIFSEPELRSLWEYAESLSRGEARGTAARDLLLAILDGRVLDADQARMFLRSNQPALRMERRMRDVARDFGEALRGAGLGDLLDNTALADQALRPLLRRLFSDPANPPSEGRLTRELLELRDTLNLLRRELERQADLDPGMRRQLLEGYLVELAAGRLDRQAALRLVAEGHAAMEAARREREEAVLEVDESELRPLDEEILEVEDADFLTEPRPVDEAVPAPEPVRLPETLPPPPGDEVESFAAAELPGAVADFIRESFSRPEQREAQETLARQNIPALRDALAANGVDANTAEGRWILSRLLVDVVRGRVETPSGPALRTAGLNAESLQARIEAERTLHRSVETLGFEANSREGLRLAAFLYRRFVREARSASDYQARLALLAHSDLREASDRLVLLGEERSAAARERTLEWAIESGQTPDSLQEVFWNALRGVTAHSLTPNGLEIRPAEAGRSPLGEIGGRVAEVLDRLHIPAFSPEGTRLANALLARAAVEARPGTPRFGRLRLEEAAARAEALPAELEPVLARIPRPSAAARAELLRWALQTGQGAESLARLGETLALLPETRAQALLRWIVANGQRPESLAALRETVEAALDAETPITNVAGIRRLHAARMEESRARSAAGLPRVPRSSPAYETLERYAFTQGPDSTMFEHRPDAVERPRIGLSPGGNRRARLWNFADPGHTPGPIVNLARRAERALRRVYECAVEIDRLERESPADPRLIEARRELDAARREVEAWENEGSVVYDASLAGARISDAQRSIFFHLRRAIEPDVDAYEDTRGKTRPLAPNPMQGLRTRILGIDGAEPDFFELADAWLDPARGDQGARPLETGRLTVVVREPGDVAAVARALEATVGEARVFRDPEFRQIAESDGSVRLEIYERSDPNARQAIRVVTAEISRRERAAETARVERNARETPEALPLPEIRPAADERPAAPPAGGERRTQPARPGNLTVSGEAAPPRSDEGTQADTPSSRSAVRDVPAPPPAEAAPAAAQRPTLRVLKGAGAGRRSSPEAAPPPPAASETALAAGTDISVMAPLPDSLDPLAPIRNAARSEAFVASLVALEEAGLIPPGTALEQYQLPGVVLRAERPGERVAVSLQPGRAEAERVLYRVEAVENGVLRLRRLGEPLEADQDTELHVGPSHELIPFQPNDYVFLRAAGPERPRPSRGPDAPPPPGGDGVELPARHAIHPELLEGAGQPFSIPPVRLPNLDYASRRAELELLVVNEGPHVWVEATLPEIDAIADAVAAHADRRFPEFGPLAEAIRADVAVMRDPAAPLESLEPVTRRLAELLRLRREFPPNDPTLDNMFRDQAAALYNRGASPRPGGSPGARTVRPPRPGTASRPETTTELRRGEGGTEAAHPTTEETVRVVPEMPRDDAPLLAEIEAMAGREVEGFSELARRTREALQRHDGRQTVPSDDAAMRAWREGRQRILADYRRERLRLARELVARHEVPGRRVLEFLQGLGGNEALWDELGAVGVERARVAEDIPPHGRPKAVEDVLPKLERRDWNSLLPFTDLFGTRIVVESYPDALAVVAAIRHRFRVRPEFSREGRLIFPSHRRVRRADAPERVHLNLLEGNRPVLDQERVGRILDGRRSGYRALHVVVEVDGLPVEIQIQTRSLYRWGHIQHEFYKNETLARPENRDLRETVDRYFAEAARYLAQAEQGVPAERPRPPELPAERLAALPRESRSEIRVALERMETLLEERPAAVERGDAAAEALHEPESAAPAAAPRPGSMPDPFDGGGNLHASFLGAGLMMAMTSMGHSPDVSLLAGILGTVLPVGILGVFRWVRGRLGSTPAAAPSAPPAPSGAPTTTRPVGPPAEPSFADFTVTAEDGAEYVFRPYRAEPGAAAWRYVASVDRVLPASRPDHFEATFAVMRQAPGEPPAIITVEIPARQARAMGLVNELGHTQRGARLFLDRIPAPGAEAPAVSPVARAAEIIPLEAAPPPETATEPSPHERPLLQPNVMGGNLTEIDGHLAGTTLNPTQLAEVLARHSRRLTLPGGELVYVATQGIDPKHPVGEDYMGGLEYRDAYGRRVYSMMVADGMGGMGNGDAAAQLSVEAFTAELRRSGDMRRAWELANAAVREFNRAFHESRDRDSAMAAAREWIRDPSRARPGAGADGGGSCSVSFSVIPPARPEGSYVLQTHFAGDASLRVYRRGPDGRYRRVYATVEQNVGAVAADSLQEGGADLRRTREIRLHPMANQVTNGVGSRDSLALAGTADGEIPEPNGRVRRAAGYEHGLVLQEGDLVLAGSDGFWENFIDTDVVGELIQGARSAEEAHRILREETHARMEVVRRLRARELPAAANGRFRFTHRGRELFIDRQYNVYDSEAATAPIDKFKPDNFSLAAYLHRPAAAAAESAAPTPAPRAPSPGAAAARRPASVPPPIPEAARRQRSPLSSDPMVARAQEIGLSLVGHVEGLTPELESRFFEGLTVEAVERPNLHYVATLSGRRGPATLEQYRIYCNWRERMALGTGGVATALTEVSRHRLRPAARAILADPRSAPLRRLQIGEFGMYLSRVIRVAEGDEGFRDYVLAVVPELRDGVMTLKRRFFYRSQSGGGWRASPFYGFGILQKGQPRFDGGGDLRRAGGGLRGARHYTAESEPLPEVLEALETLDREGPRAEMTPDEIFRIIGLGGADEGAEGNQRQAIVQSMMHGYGERTNYVEAVPIAHLQTDSLQPGRVFHTGRNDRTVDRVLETMRDLDYPEGFIPDFAAEPRRSYRARHTLLGEVTYREYGGSRLRTVGDRERELIWTVAEDGRRADGSTRVWIQSIRLADARPTSYGVPDQVLDTGILTSKPVEYASQAELLEGTPYVAALSNGPSDGAGESRYVDITPALDVLAPIRAYRAARGLPLAPQAAKPGEAAPVRRPASVPPPIPAAARRPAAAPRPPAAVPNTTAVAPAGISGDLVIAGGEHLYRVARGGRRAGDRRYVYQLRLDSVSGPEAPLFQEIESPRALNPAEIEAVLDGRRPAGVTVREGWRISDLRPEAGTSATGTPGTLPLSLVPNTPGMRSVQLDFYVLPSERTPLDSPSENPRVSLVDPTLRGASGREPVLSLGGRSESGDPARREWILEVRQDRVPVLVDGQRVLPFQGFVRLSECTRIRVGLSEFVFRGQSLIPETTAPLRLSVPPQSRPAEGLPIAAAFERVEPGPVGEDGEDGSH